MEALAEAPAPMGAPEEPYIVESPDYTTVPDYSVPTMEEPDITMDDFFNREVNAEIHTAATAQRLPESGTYVSEPDPDSGMTVDLSRRDEDGRRIVVVRGSMLHRKTQKRAYIRARMSPDVVYKDDGDTFDFLYQVWDSAVAAYSATFGEMPASEGHVIEYLAKFPAAYVGRRIGVPTKRNPEPTGDPGFLIFNIAPVRAK